MKKIIVAGLLLLTFGAVNAQIERKQKNLLPSDSIAAVNAREKPNNQGRRDMLAQLDLTKEQRSTLKEMQQANRSARESIQNDNKLTDQERKSKLRALQREQAQKLQSVLTPQQLEKFKAMRQNNQ